ncbi:single-stranded DNA-binding protein [Glutamicibacter protophormiae]|uniref:Single-stranded DNA-binding protein n=1 Tax=Kocuria varians TaxID=1272 RepID=A0A7D7Q3N1_KOCVA|nr:MULTISPECIES: single-stranded DNA-binding protein [Kocuria]WNB89531.1 single-stranded DNA-binding protein [Glutamicibacter protophormiae]MDN5632168.1 single-stranded DNA-binding protein [Kocuria sp.]QMS57341.1 Single-stranded DNA-binding protein 1 [Kocuria varians]RUP81439.1 single-stranded DNA-binding protein [Kocuria sp. HSID17590]RUQ06123.1 single-stranded DNA-binding protein [Kocuria sp. HSID17582]
MSEQVTLRGFVGKDPQTRMFDDGTSVAWFRLATTSRRFDAATNTWHDGTTNWYTVRCFRTLAMHVKASIHCGQPVLVTGKLGINEWQSENGPRTEVRVDATSIGHDLAFGTANFARAGGRPQQGGQDGAQNAGDGNGSGDGARFRSSRSLGLGEDGVVDTTSGAVLDLAADDHTFDGLSDNTEGAEAEARQSDEPVTAGAH